jgi:hypothetical protein
MLEYRYVFDPRWIVPHILGRHDSRFYRDISRPESRTRTFVIVERRLGDSAVDRRGMGWRRRANHT